MRYILDWHIHSKYSRACSKDLELPNIARWCERKGIHIVATGDWTHPAWFLNLEKELEESEPGIYKLRSSYNSEASPTRFILVTEISQIYKKGEKTRRIHNLIFSPSLETCSKVNQELEKLNFNLKSDGRPILGIDSEELYKILKTIDEKIILVPAHAWTPWYAVFGSKSGFDSLEECFGSMTPYIYAIETGLSSDPPMNWQVSDLDRVMLISNSDAHSCRNLGREANVMEIKDLSYDECVRILREKDSKAFLYTIEFYPEEGKYHYDGCANCGVVADPKTTKKYGGYCPSCKRPLTLGVLNRVYELSNRAYQKKQKNKIPYKSIIPLQEILAECLGVKSTHSLKVVREYERLTRELDNEFSILLDLPIETIEQASNIPFLAEAIKKMREGSIHILPGYDGVFGEVHIFNEADFSKQHQSSIF